MLGRRATGPSGNRIRLSPRSDRFSGRVIRRHDGLAMQAGERCDEVGETLALYDDVFAHTLGGEFGIAGNDRLHNALVLVKRRRQPIADA